MSTQDLADSPGVRVDWDQPQDFLILAEMHTVKHGRVQFWSHGNGVFARTWGSNNSIPRRDWSPGMRAVVRGLPRDLVYWPLAFEDDTGD